LDIPEVVEAGACSVEHERHPGGDAMISGQVEFYDEPTAWGLIRGDDGHLYDLRGNQLGGSLPRVGDRVLFEPQAAPGGPRAVGVRRAKPAAAPAPRGVRKA
jgi:cold shock CspA family protein